MLENMPVTFESLVNTERFKTAVHELHFGRKFESLVNTERFKTYPIRLLL